MCLLPNAGKDGEAPSLITGLLTGFAARLAATLEARMTLFEAEKTEIAGIEKDAKTIAALARAAIIVHAVKVAEDKASDIQARPPSAHNDNDGEGDEMEPDERGHMGRSEEDMAALRREVERRFEGLARSFDRKGILPDGAGRDDSSDDGLLARAGEADATTALE